MRNSCRLYIVTCLCCGKIFTRTYPRKFCSMECANSFPKSEETKIKLSVGAGGNKSRTGQCQSIEERLRKSIASRKVFIPESELYDLYVVQHKSLRYIAQIYNVDKATITFYLTKANIHIRDKSESQIGKVISVATKERLAKSRKGTHFTEEQKEKQRLAQKGKHNYLRLGRKPESIIPLKVCLNCLEPYSLKNKFFCSRKCKANYGQTDEAKRKIGIAHRGMLHTLDVKERLRNAHIGKKLSEEHKQKISISNIGRVFSKESKNKIRISITNLWKSPEFAKKALGNSSKRPNKVESKLLNILNVLFPDEWVYVGDGSLIIGGKCPDFFNIVTNTLVELFGDYWHRGENPQNRIDEFKKYGYSTLVLWEKEVKNFDVLMRKLYEFMV